ncbi:FMN-binding negative transcriptional regulator [Pinibacter soli]|uniref:FMN-binding negative transcriptional regulator n=1 Tax=Pinibacter soli TaxID=3044211 RepID=A0ABT6RH89_9BACT|nr:FMN-binding negative transcriptional regulator [Pinibacter soli]MDI3321786.1 FMN-binding negative transcriptional regulator [Pinibacter soli]
MYGFPYYKTKDHAKVLQFMQAHPFVMLVGCEEQQCPVASQVPILISEKDGRMFLEGHVMRNTDHQKAFAANSNVLAIFTGPHTFVSASWYTNPQQASTWNYMAVHARGKLTFLSEERLIDILRRTTEQFESNSASEASFDKLPHEYVTRLAKAIVGFEIEVTALDHTFKLSQNRDEESYKNITHHLSVSDNADANEIAKMMEAGHTNVYNKEK